MKLNDMRVATKLWSVILGLLLAMLVVAVWTRYITLNVNNCLASDVALWSLAVADVVLERGVIQAA